MYDSFGDELEKIAKEGSNWWKPALGIAGGAALGLGAFALAHKGVRRNLGAQIKSLMSFGKGVKQLEGKAKIPSSVQQEARAVAAEIRAAGLDPKKISIGVSGPSGVGKSTFTAALKKETGMNRVDLDRVNPGILSTKGFVRDAERNIKPGTITEQMNLLSAASPDKMDVIINMSKPAGTVREQLYSRGRGAVGDAVLDQKRVRKSIDVAFHSTDGKVLEPAKGIQMKFKPKGGFKPNQHLDSQVKQFGVDPVGLTRREKVYAITNERKPVLPGMLPLMKGKTLAGMPTSLAAGGAVGGAGAHYLTKDKK
jgi:hypothetical protein